MTELVIAQLIPELVADERKLSRGTLAAQYREHIDKTGMKRRYGPYVSLVLRVSEEKQEWFYLGKIGTSKYRAKLERVREILEMNSHLSNAELSRVLKEVWK